MRLVALAGQCFSPSALAALDYQKRLGGIRCSARSLPASPEEFWRRTLNAGQTGIGTARASPATHQLPPVTQPFRPSEGSPILLWKLGQAGGYNGRSQS